MTCLVSGGDIPSDSVFPTSLVMMCLVSGSDILRDAILFLVVTSLEMMCLFPVVTPL